MLKNKDRHFWWTVVYFLPQQTAASIVLKYTFLVDCGTVHYLPQFTAASIVLKSIHIVSGPVWCTQYCSDLWYASLPQLTAAPVVVKYTV